MRYQKSNRIQHENYCCSACFLVDCIETLYDDFNMSDQINIISDKYTTEMLLKTICKLEIEDFEFDLQLLDYYKEDDTIDEYRIVIMNDGSVYIESAIDKNAEYYDCDGLIFVESEVSEDSYSGNNRHNDVVIFSIDEYF